MPKIIPGICHIHFTGRNRVFKIFFQVIYCLVQPVGSALMERFDAHGPTLQVRMFEANEPMDPAAMAQAADRIRERLGIEP